MESRGFKKLDHDDCLLTNSEIIVLFWVDDYIFYSKNNSSIDTSVLDLKEDFLLKEEEDMFGFLGPSIDRTTEEAISLTQSGLIDIIL